MTCKRQVPALSTVLGACYEVRVIKKAYIQRWSSKMFCGIVSKPAGTARGKERKEIKKTNKECTNRIGMGAGGGWIPTKNRVSK